MENLSSPIHNLRVDKLYKTWYQIWLQLSILGTNAMKQFYGKQLTIGNFKGTFIWIPKIEEMSWRSRSRKIKKKKKRLISGTKVVQNKR